MYQQLERHYNKNYSIFFNERKLPYLINQDLVKRADKNDSCELLQNTIVSYMFPNCYKRLKTMLHMKQIDAFEFRNKVIEMYSELDPCNYLSELDFLAR